MRLVPPMLVLALAAAQAQDAPAPRGDYAMATDAAHDRVVLPGLRRIPLR